MLYICLDCGRSIELSDMLVKESNNALICPYCFPLNWADNKEIERLDNEVNY